MRTRVNVRKYQFITSLLGFPYFTAFRLKDLKETIPIIICEQLGNWGILCITCLPRNTVSTCRTSFDDTGQFYLSSVSSFKHIHMYVLLYVHMNI